MIGRLAFLCLLLPPSTVQDRPGPWDGDAWLLESKDGLRFTRVRKLVEGAGVPTLIADAQGRLIAHFQWFPKDRQEAFDRVAVSFSSDEGATWTPPRPIVMADFPEDMMRPFDPTVVAFDDGRFRMYFTSRKGREVPAIYSALSDDAITFRFESGPRFSVENEHVIDCAVGRLGKTWHLYAPLQGHEGKGYHAVSTDGLNFERRKNVSVDARGSWLGCAVTDGETLRFYGTMGGGSWSATSADGESWKLDRAESRDGTADPGVARTKDGRWLKVATAFARGQERAPGPRADAVLAVGNHLFVLEGGTLLKLDAATGRTVGSLRLDGSDRKAYFDYMRGLDSTRAVRKTCTTFDPPRAVKFGRKSSLGGGGFPRPIKLGDRLWVFRARASQSSVIRLDANLFPDGVEKDLTPKGSRDVDHDLTVSGDYVYHYAMKSGGAGQVRKYDKDFNVVAQTEIIRAGGTDLILDQNIAVLDGKVYAAGEYRERGPWRSTDQGEQNIPPDPKQARGVYLRVFDLDLRPLGDKKLVADIPGAAVRNQFWGLGTSQLRADGYHCLVVHTPVGNVARFPRGESIGARQIFVLRYDSDFRFVDAHGPLSDTDRDNFWCTGSWFEDGRYYIVYASVAGGYIPGPGEESTGKIVDNLRLGIFDETFREIETVDLTRLGEGGMLPDILKVGKRLYVTYVKHGHEKAVLQELVIP